ncbi:MAG: DUF447 family protein [Planctomycetaceae bacterium]|nr:DUF447 family protein [Planctomycetales bacterium]MCB9923757.1 DUF447 family protein [Planctomycetaceae bacterium]
MILEGVVTTLNEDGSPNISPMGPEVDTSLTRFVLKPYQSSRTYQSLKRTGEGVLHVTDDVELIARAAINQFDELPATFPASAVAGVVLADACRWYEFRVSRLDDRDERTRIECDVVDRGRIRDFFGFNRAKHAVLEAAILATRTRFLPQAEVEKELDRLQLVVQKTAGQQEFEAFQVLTRFISAAYVTDPAG